MELLLEREIFTESSTIGSLYIWHKDPGGDPDRDEFEFLCYTLEDKCRQEFGKPWTPDLKIPKKTAIAYDRFEIIIDLSNRFKKLMPHILGVPSFEGIRIHIANSCDDVEGCVGVGKTVGRDFIGKSKDAFNDILFPLLEKTLKTEKIWITISKAED